MVAGRALETSALTQKKKISNVICAKFFAIISQNRFLAIDKKNRRRNVQRNPHPNGNQLGQTRFEPGIDQIPGQDFSTRPKKKLARVRDLDFFEWETHLEPRGSNFRYLFFGRLGCIFLENDTLEAWMQNDTSKGGAKSVSECRGYLGVE